MIQVAVAEGGEVAIDMSGTDEEEFKHEGGAPGGDVDNNNNTNGNDNPGGKDGSTSSGGGLSFTPMTLAFRQLFYTVPLPNGESIDLLKGIDAYFKPGTMTALMGSSGAGKTTLLDVIAGRKTSGTIKGDLFVNGAPIEMGPYSRVIVSRWSFFGEEGGVSCPFV